MFEDDKHIVTGGRKLRDVRIVDNGDALAVEIEQTDLRLLTLLIPAEEGLQIGTRLMVSAAEAKRMARVGKAPGRDQRTTIELLPAVDLVEARADALHVPGGLNG